LTRTGPDGGAWNNSVKERHKVKDKNLGENRGKVPLALPLEMWEPLGKVVGIWVFRVPGLGKRHSAVVGGRSPLPKRREERTSGDSLKTKNTEGDKKADASLWSGL